MTKVKFARLSKWHHKRSGIPKEYSLLYAYDEVGGSLWSYSNLEMKSDDVGDKGI